MSDERLTSKARDWLLNTPRGQSWYQKHYDLDKMGTWRIEGEDDGNPNYGGSSKDYLAIVKGPLWKVVNAAVAMKGFFSYGSGGDIRPYKVPTVTDLDDETNNQILRDLEIARSLVKELKKSAKERGLISDD